MAIKGLFICSRLHHRKSVLDNKLIILDYFKDNGKQRPLFMDIRRCSSNSNHKCKYKFQLFLSSIARQYRIRAFADRSQYD